MSEQEKVEEQKQSRSKDLTIKSVLRYAPIAYLIYIFCGLMFETIYFNMFNVNVLTYIDFTEVLMLLYSDVVLYIVIVLVGLVYYVIVGWFFDWLFAIFNWLFKRLLKGTRIIT